MVLNPFERRFSFMPEEKERLEKEGGKEKVQEAQERIKEAGKKLNIEYAPETGVVDLEAEAKKMPEKNAIKKAFQEMKKEFKKREQMNKKQQEEENPHNVAA